MVVPFFKETLPGRCLITVVAMLVALSAGTLYAWAAYSRDLRDHFGWSLAEATSVNTAGIFGDSLLAVLIGLMLNSCGPVFAMGYSTVLLSGSFFALWWLAVERMPNVMAASFFYMCNGKGSVGFYMVALFSVTATWPSHLTGTGVALLDVAFSMSSVSVANIYPMIGSVTTFYSYMTIITLTVGVALLLCHVDWALLIWGGKGKKDKEQLEAVPEEDEEEPFAPVHSVPMPVKRAATFSYGTSDATSGATLRDPNVLAKPVPIPEESAHFKMLHRRSTFVEEMVITHRVDDSEISKIFGVMPCADELRAKYPGISIIGALLKTEFLVSAGFCFFIFTPTAVLNSQLATIKRQMDVDMDVASLLTTVMLFAACGKFGGGAVSDATVHTKYFGRQFYIFAANVIIFVCFGLLAFTKHTEALLVGTLVAMGIARGAGSVIFTTLLKESFGARMLGVFVGLVYFVFFVGYAFWSYIFVQCRDGTITVGFWPLVFVGCLVPLMGSGYAWHANVREH